MAGQAEFGVGGEHDEVLETYKMFAYDEGWSRRINEAIDSGLTAEAAIERVQQRTRMRMREIDDPLLRRPHARPGGPVEPPAAHRLGPARHRGQHGPARRFDPDRRATSARPNCSNTTSAASRA